MPLLARAIVRSDCKRGCDTIRFKSAVPEPMDASLGRLAAQRWGVCACDVPGYLTQDDAWARVQVAAESDCP